MNNRDVKYWFVIRLSSGTIQSLCEIGHPYGECDFLVCCDKAVAVCPDGKRPSVRQYVMRRHGNALE